tara:strand:+ start:153 stop:779 length:627 start_codon:yes stop_codon:yes gene_type:complete
MSTKISKKKFTEMLRSLIRQEIEEASTTATAGGAYDTPKAFSTGSGHPTDGEVAGLKKVKEQVNEVMFAVKIKKDDTTIQTIVGASSKGQAKTKVGKMIKGGMKNIVDVQRVQPSLGNQIDKKLENVNEGKYHDWRNDESLSPKQKIGRSMREVKNSLTELSKMIDMSVRLKNELSVDSSSYWKNTHKALNNISERLVKLANKVGKLQ